MIEVGLKLKYRNPSHKVIRLKQPGEPEIGTLVYVGAKNHPNPGSQVNGRIAGMKPKHRKTMKHLRPRRRAYGPF